jgi:hypothetical protein
MESMKELWTGRVELLTPVTEFGDTRCFTNVFVWANDAADFAHSVACHLETESISLLRVEECHRLADEEEIPEQTRPFFEWVKKHPEEFATTDRHYYPSKPD